MKRSPLKRSSVPMRTRRPNPLSAAELAAREEFAGGGPCIVCPAEGGVCSGRVQSHHAIDKQALKRRGLRAYLWDVRNRVRVCEYRHESHTTRAKPIPRELLPAAVSEFAAEVGLTWWIEKHYPVAEEVAA